MINFIRALFFLLVNSKYHNGFEPIYATVETTRETIEEQCGPHLCDTKYDQDFISKDGYCRGNIVIGVGAIKVSLWVDVIACQLKKLEDCTVLDGSIIIQGIHAFNDPYLFEINENIKDCSQQRVKDALEEAFVFPEIIQSVLSNNSTHRDHYTHLWRQHKVVKYTQKLVEITGVLDLSSLRCDLQESEKLGDVNFDLVSVGQLFPSLRTIRGNQIVEIYNKAISIRDTNFKSLRLSSLTAITRGKVFIYNNHNLCVHNSQRIMDISDESENQLEINQNRRRAVCESEAQGANHNCFEDETSMGYKRSCYNIGYSACWDFGLRCDKDKPPCNHLNSMYCQINVPDVLIDCSRLCIGGCDYYFQMKFRELSVDTIEYELNNLNYFANKCSACDWKQSLSIIYESSNVVCYSRQLHGTYNLNNNGSSQKMTFYNGCPSDVPWRGGNIDDIRIKNSKVVYDTDDFEELDTKLTLIDPMFDSRTDNINGWQCMTKQDCLTFYYKVFHCDTPECFSGACTFLGQWNHEEKYQCYGMENVDFAVPVRPSPCRNGFVLKEDNKFADDTKVCEPTAFPSGRICHFCTEIKITQKEDLDIYSDCTEIRAVGGLQIIEYEDDILHLEKALGQITTLDCLSIHKSPAIYDLKFFLSLENITGITWAVDTNGVIISEKPCEKLSIKNNMNLANLFPAKNIETLAKNIRAKYSLTECDFQQELTNQCGLQVCNHTYNGMFDRNQKLCPLEFFDFITVEHEKDVAKYTGSALVLFYITVSEYGKKYKCKPPDCCDKACLGKRIKQNLHRILQKNFNCGDLLSCSIYRIENTQHKLEADYYNITFDPFYHNRNAEDELGVKINENYWNFELSLIDAKVYYIEDKDRRYFENRELYHTHASTKGKWKKLHFDKKKNELGITRKSDCFTGTPWKNITDDECWPNCDNCTYQEDVDKYLCQRCDQLYIKLTSAELNRNTPYTYYVEQTIDLRKSVKTSPPCETNCLLTARSPHQKFVTKPSTANKVTIKSLSENVTSVYLHWTPNPVPTGQLESFMILSKRTTNHKLHDMQWSDNNSCEAFSPDSSCYMNYAESLRKYAQAVGTQDRDSAKNNVKQKVYISYETCETDYSSTNIKEIIPYLQHVNDYMGKFLDQCIYSCTNAEDDANLTDYPVDDSYDDDVVVLGDGFDYGFDYETFVKDTLTDSYSDNDGIMEAVKKPTVELVDNSRKCIMINLVCDRILSPDFQDVELTCQSLFQNNMTIEFPNKYACTNDTTYKNVSLPLVNATYSNIYEKYFVHQCVRCYKDMEIYFSKYSLTKNMKLMKDLVNLYIELTNVPFENNTPTFKTKINNLENGKKFDIQIYACNMNVPCGIATEMNDIMTKESGELETYFDQKRTQKQVSYTEQNSETGIAQLRPRQLNDQPRMFPFILDSSFASKNALEIYFRAPDWRIQNGFIMFYVLQFERDGKKTNVIFPDELAKQNMLQQLNTTRKTKEGNDFCTRLAKFNEQFEAQETVLIDCEANQTSAEKKWQDVQEEGNLTISSRKRFTLPPLQNKCFIRFDSDHCGFRLIRFSDITLSENFFESGKDYKIYDFRVITTGVTKKMPNSDDIMAELMESTGDNIAYSMRRHINEVYTKDYCKGDDEKCEKLFASFSISSNDRLYIMIVISFVLLLLVGFIWVKANGSKKTKDKTMVETTNPDYLDETQGNDYRDYEVDYSGKRIDPRHVTVNYTDKVGVGHFGSVYSGYLSIDHFIENNEEYSALFAKSETPNQIKVAVKVAKNSDFSDFFKEQGMLDKFGNQGYHTVCYFGWTHTAFQNSFQEQRCLVMEYIAGGDLRTWLRKYNVNYTSNTAVPFTHKRKLTLKRLFKICADVADGMLFLSKLGTVHRDLAARNCLVQASNNEEYETIKICDFGMTREITNTSEYKVSEGAALPVRWCSPESLSTDRFCFESDVWSYGIFLYEVASLGENPYSNLDDGKLKDRLIKEREGLIHEFNCLYEMRWKNIIFRNLEYYNITEEKIVYYMLPLIQQCCSYDVKKRPRFDAIMRIFANLDAIWNDGEVGKHPLTDEPYKDTFFYFNKHDENNDGSITLGSIDTEDERTIVTDQTPLIKDHRRSSCDIFSTSKYDRDDSGYR